MDTQEIIHTRIEAYLTGMLGADEKTEFEARLAADESLRNEVARHRKAHLTIQHGLHQSRKARLIAIDQEIGAPHQASRRIVIIRRLAVAASFLVLVAAGMHFYAYQKYNTVSVAESLFVAPPTEQFRNREEYVTSLGEKFADAERLFHEGNYTAAKQQYLTIIHENTLLKAQAEWNLTLCHYAMDPSSPQFTMLFDRILADPQHEYHAQAAKLNKTMHRTFYKWVRR